MNKSVAVVVTYNRIEQLKLCVEHLKNQTVPVDIMVVDNASTDGTAELFKEPEEGVIYFSEDKGNKKPIALYRLRSSVIFQHRCKSRRRGRIQLRYAQGM